MSDWVSQGQSDRQAFLEELKKATNLEVFDLYEEVSQSDDWDGAFTRMQQWKRDMAAEEMRRRLA